MMHHRHGRPQPSARKAMLAASVLLGSLGTAMAGAADQPPAELKMILSPGQGRSDVITFSTDGEDQPATKESRPVETAEPTPMTVLPPEATAESAAEREALVSGKSRPRTLAYPSSFTLGAGYRWDSVNWNIADSDYRPNILSELQYDDIESLTLSGTLRWSNSANFYVRGGFDIGRTLSGDVQDSDYLGNNRTYEFSRSYSDSDSGSLVDATIGVGYRFDLPLSGSDRYMHLMPLVGYSYHSQDLDMTDGVQVIADYGFNMPLGPFDGLDSNYDAHWAGPWIGLDMELVFDQSHALLASLEYHWADYEADANWNLRGDFAHPVSYEHDSDGDGIVASITYRYTPNPKWFWTVGFRYSRFEADSGTDTTYLSDGSVVAGPLNEAEWESYAVIVGLGFKF